ncbi:hypothetical protein [Salinimicrobium oceani]|uniref:Uncharacterized protein n=1 Tax=Salinimicrobium oceani TaxID=2722702 RepID=A0ABX1D0F4_9FLAO|nr:hypothetical protein [Salinimicrobium oceani]NJW53542.1 hypothetical protein [Salinimicrobium oceani]
MVWYQRLISRIEVAGNGMVAEFLRSTVETGLFSKAPNINALDASIPGDVSEWFASSFKPWFMKVTLNLGVLANQEILTSQAFINTVNQVVESLNVARSYYAKEADFSMITSLENAARLKAQMCEEAASAVFTAYEKALAQFGLVPQYGMAITESSSFDGSTPEVFKWKKITEAYHKKIIDVNKEGTENQEQQQKTSHIPQYLPWVFTAAFGLIAWSAAAKKQ